jgi:hypothetical protein
MSARTHQKGRKPSQSKQHPFLWIALFVVLSLLSLGGLFAVFAALQPDQPVEVAQTIPTAQRASSQAGGHQMDPSEVRMVKIAPKSEPMVLDTGGNAVAIVTLLEGKVPAGAKTAIVQADLDCAPDQSGPMKGWSHCKNPVKFDDGSTAVLQHHHKLSEVACFAKDQTLSIG